MARIIDAFSQFFDDNGNPLVSGFLQFTAAGTNNTDKDTFKDIQETIPNANPVQLDAAGRCPNVFGTGSYRVTSYSQNVISNVPGQQIQQFDPVSGTQTASDFSTWDINSTYTETDIVKGSDNLYYQSLTSGNVGNNPTSDIVNWEMIDFVRTWNTNKTYSIGDEAVASDFITYRSRVSSNQGNDPTTSPDEWLAPAVPFKATASGATQFNSTDQVDVVAGVFAVGSLAIGDVVRIKVSAVFENNSGGTVVFSTFPALNTNIVNNPSNLSVGTSATLKSVYDITTDILVTGNTTANVIRKVFFSPVINTEGVDASATTVNAFKLAQTINDITSSSNTFSLAIDMDTADASAGWTASWANVEHISQ